MGYFSKFCLEVWPSNCVIPQCDHLVDINDKFCRECGSKIESVLARDRVVELIYEEIGLNPFIEPVKWYDHEKDMLEISKIFPKLLFIIKKYGEETEDIWVKYFQKGKMQAVKAKIVFPEFDSAKMIRIDIN